jgi:hypothetical protein
LVREEAKSELKHYLSADDDLATYFDDADSPDGESPAPAEPRQCSGSALSHPRYGRFHRSRTATEHDYYGSSQDNILLLDEWDELDCVRGGCRCGERRDQAGNASIAATSTDSSSAPSSIWGGESAGEYSQTGHADGRRLEWEAEWRDASEPPPNHYYGRRDLLEFDIRYHRPFRCHEFVGLFKEWMRTIADGCEVIMAVINAFRDRRAFWSSLADHRSYVIFRAAAMCGRLDAIEGLWQLCAQQFNNYDIVWVNAKLPLALALRGLCARGDLGLVKTFIRRYGSLGLIASKDLSAAVQEAAQCGRHRVLSWFLRVFLPEVTNAAREFEPPSWFFDSYVKASGMPSEQLDRRSEMRLRWRGLMFKQRRPEDWMTFEQSLRFRLPLLLSRACHGFAIRHQPPISPPPTEITPHDIVLVPHPDGGHTTVLEVSGDSILRADQVFGVYADEMRMRATRRPILYGPATHLLINSLDRSGSLRLNDTNSCFQTGLAPTAYHVIKPKVRRDMTEANPDYVSQPDDAPISPEHDDDDDDDDRRLIMTLLFNSNPSERSETKHPWDSTSSFAFATAVAPTAIDPLANSASTSAFEIGTPVNGASLAAIDPVANPTFFPLPRSSAVSFCTAQGPLASSPAHWGGLLPPGDTLSFAKCVLLCLNYGARNLGQNCRWATHSLLFLHLAELGCPVAKLKVVGGATGQTFSNILDLVAHWVVAIPVALIVLAYVLYPSDTPPNRPVRTVFYGTPRPHVAQYYANLP